MYGADAGVFLFFLFPFFHNNNNHLLQMHRAFPKCLEEEREEKWWVSGRFECGVERQRTVEV
jgi:hypothetical protein